MRILIKHATTGEETVLCDGPVRGLDRMMGPIGDGIEIDDQHVTQPLEYLRAASAEYADRRNGKIASSFTVIRECASAVAAHLWQIGFHISCVRSGSLYIIESDAAGGVSRCMLPKAVINIRSKPMGVSRQLTFSINSGALQPA